jgi:hypothetical protein
MPEVRVDQAVEDLLDALWDHGDETLVERLEDAIDSIRNSDPHSRAHRFIGPDRPDGAWVIPLVHSGETWLVVWTDDEGTAVVHDIGRTELL